jgi:hypothetical protein
MWLDGQTERLKKAEAGELHGFAPTKYIKASQEQGEYWAKPHEMFARAFETYMAQNLEDRNQSSPYLIAGIPTKKTENGFVGDAWGDLYLKGDEAARSNAAFKRLFAAIRVNDGRVLNATKTDNDKLNNCGERFPGELLSPPVSLPNDTNVSANDSLLVANRDETGRQTWRVRNA